MSSDPSQHGCTHVGNKSLTWKMKHLSDSLRRQQHQKKTRKKSLANFHSCGGQPLNNGLHITEAALPAVAGFGLRMPKSALLEALTL